MAPSRIDIIRARLQGISTTLGKAPASEKNDLVGTQLAEEFNRVRDSIAEGFPDLADALPKPVLSSGPFAEMNKADASYLDLEAFCEQVLNLLRLVDES